MMITLAIYGAGMYTLKRWNLQTTSRGVLVIVLLLIPLNFLAAVAGPSMRHENTMLYVLALLVGLGVFGGVTLSAAKALAERGWFALWTGIVGCSLGQLLVDGLLEGEGLAAISLTPWTATAVLAPATLSFLAAIFAELHDTAQSKQIDRKQTESVFLLLGLSAFALAATVGLFISHCPNILEALTFLAPSAALAAAGIMSCGLLIHARCSDKKLAAFRMSGSALAIFGGMISLGVLVLASTDPLLLATIAAVQFVLITALAIFANLAVLHYAGVACMAIAAITIHHLMFVGIETGDEPSRWWIVVMMCAGRSSLLLLGMTGVVGGGAWLLKREKLDDHARAWIHSGIALASLALLIAVGVGFFAGPQADLMTIVFAVYAAAALAAGIVTKQDELSWAGSGLLLLTLIHAIAFVELVPATSPWIASLLLHATAMTVLAGFVNRASFKNITQQIAERTNLATTAAATPQKALLLSGFATTCIAMLLSMIVRDAAIFAHAGFLAWTAMVFLGLMVVIRLSGSDTTQEQRQSLQWTSERLFDDLHVVMLWLFQFTATMTVCYLTAASCQQNEWGENWFNDVRHVQWQIVAATLCCIAWTGLEFARGRAPVLQGLIPFQPFAFRDLLQGVVLVAMLILVVSSCWPGVVIELGYEQTGMEFAPYNSMSWLAWFLVVVAVELSVFQKPSRERIVAVILATVAAPCLLAIHFESVTAVATALRWLLALYALAAAVKMLVLFTRERPLAIVHRFFPLENKDSQVNEFSIACLLVSALPVYLLTILAFTAAITGETANGPVDGSFFHRMGEFWAYSIPLIMVVASIVVSGVACRRQNYLFVGSVALQGAVTMGCCLGTKLAGQPFDGAFAVELLQVNAIALAVYGLLWLALVYLLWRDDAVGNALIELQCIGAVIAANALAVWIAILIFDDPGIASRMLQQLGSWPSYFTLGATLALLVLASRILRRAEFISFIFDERWQGTISVLRSVRVLLPVVLTLLAATASTFETSPSSWLAYHTFLVGLLLIASVYTAVEAVRPKLLSGNTAYVIAFVLLATVFSIRGVLVDALELWWTAGALVWSSVLVGILAVCERNRAFTFGATALALAAATAATVNSPMPGGTDQRVVNVVFANLLAALVISGIWQGIEIWFQRSRNEPLDVNSRIPAVHRILPWIAVIVCMLFTFPDTITAALGNAGELRTELTYLTLAALGIVLFTAFWDRVLWQPLVALYLWGGIVTIQSVSYWELNFENLVVGIAGAVAVYSLVAAWFYSRHDAVVALGNQLSMTNVDAQMNAAASWLAPITLLLAGGIALFDFVGVLSLSAREMRMACGAMPAVLGVCFVLLTERNRPSNLRFVAVSLLGLSAVFLSWADREPSLALTSWLIRIIRVIVVSGAMCFLFGVVFARRIERESPWRDVMWKSSIVGAGLAVILLLMILPIEGSLFDKTTGLPDNIDIFHLGAVAVSFAGIMVTLLAFALAPGRDPLALSERGKMAYVYAAEFVGLLLFVHIYFSAPWLFSEEMRQYWPFIVMAIAFAGVSFSEFARRSGNRVLSEPLYHTGALLPLLPALGFWFIPAASDYSLVMFTIGMMYLVMAMLRNSMANSVMAVVAGNIALWSLLTESERSIFEQPQFWFIPPALSVLIASHVNRKSLTASQLASIRYLCMIVIYISSTAQIFVVGIGEALWPPMILATLAVIGAMIGIAFQIRAFLYTGSSFLLLAVVSMVWHAYERLEHAAVWWAFGITLGIAILTLFAFFEKNRPMIHAWINRHASVGAIANSSCDGV